MAAFARRHLRFALHEAPEEKPTLGLAFWQKYFRSDLQPTTTLMLVAILMIFYSRIVGA